MEVHIRPEYQKIYEKIVEVVAVKEARDYLTKSKLLKVYRKFDSQVDPGIITFGTNEATSENHIQKIPELNTIYERSLIQHPIDSLLSAYENKVQTSQDSYEEEQSQSDIIDDNVRYLYDELNSKSRR